MTLTGVWVELAVEVEGGAARTAEGEGAGGSRWAAVQHDPAVEAVADALRRGGRVILGSGSASRRGACVCARPPPVPRNKHDKHADSLHDCCLPACLPARGSRAAILDALAESYGFTYEVVKADIDEKAIRQDDPRDLVLALARAKAAAIRERLGGSGDAGLLITCDQVVVHEGRILEKPEGEAEVRGLWGRGGRGGVDLQQRQRVLPPPQPP